MFVTKRYYEATSVSAMSVSLAKKILLKLSVTRCVRVEVSSVESNERTAAAVI